MALSADMTLAEFWLAHYVPHCLEDPSSRNLEGYRRALRLWAMLTPDLPLRLITSGTMSDYKVALSAVRHHGRPLATNTIRKHIQHVQWVLDKAGPRGPRGLRSAAGLIADVPYTKPPRRTQAHYPAATAAEIAGLYGTAEEAILPRVAGLRPGSIWRALLATMCCTALRIGQLAELQWQDVRLDERRLVLPAGICRKSRVEEVHPLHGLAVERLLVIRSHAGLVFHLWPQPHARQTIYRELHRLQDLAGVRRFGFHDIRRHVLTDIARVSPAAAQLAAGHASYETTKRYQDLEILAEAVGDLSVFRAMG